MQHHFVHEAVSKIKGEVVMEFVLLKERCDDVRTMVTRTDALNTNVHDVLLSYKRRGDIENYYRHFKQYLGWVGTRSGL